MGSLSIATEELTAKEMYFLLRGSVIHPRGERIDLGQIEDLNPRIDATREEALRPDGRLGRANFVRIRVIETILRLDDRA